MERLKGALVIQRFRIGPPPAILVAKYGKEWAQRWAKIYKVWIDGIAIFKDKVIFIEAKIRNPLRGLDELIRYRRLAPLTPELEKYKDLKWIFRLVIPVEIPMVIEEAKAQDIEVDIFYKPWLMPYLMY